MQIDINKTSNIAIQAVELMIRDAQKEGMPDPNKYTDFVRSKGLSDPEELFALALLHAYVDTFRVLGGRTFLRLLSIKGDTVSPETEEANVQNS